jgi:hypothetical protein
VRPNDEEVYRSCLRIPFGYSEAHRRHVGRDKAIRRLPPGLAIVYIAVHTMNQGGTSCD